MLLLCWEAYIASRQSQGGLQKAGKDGVCYDSFTSNILLIC